MRITFEEFKNLNESLTADLTHDVELNKAYKKAIKVFKQDATKNEVIDSISRISYDEFEKELQAGTEIEAELTTLYLDYEFSFTNVVHNNLQKHVVTITKHFKNRKIHRESTYYIEFYSLNDMLKRFEIHGLSIKELAPRLDIIVMS